MINSFQIKGFRRHKDTKFEQLNRINLFLGNNNTGKTSILESIFAFACGENIAPLLFNSILRTKEIKGPYDLIERLLGSQHNPNVKPFTFSFSATFVDGSTQTFEHTLDPYHIFADFKPNLMGTFGSPKIKISQDKQDIPNPIPITPIGKWYVRNNNRNRFNFEFQFPPMNSSPIPVRDPFIQARFVDILSHRDQQENTQIYSLLKREGKMDDFSTQLKRTFPSILDIDLIPYPDGSTSPVSFKINHKGLLPIYDFGDGMQRWYNIFGGMLLYKNSIHCIEEVDATFHPNAQKDLSLNLYKYSKEYNNQLFMTSHSIEFVDNLLESIYGSDLNDGEDIVRIFTLKNDPITNELKIRVLTGKEAFESREKYQMELR